MNPPTLNDLYHRAEALAQDLRTLQENEKPLKPETDLVLRRHQTGKWSVRVGEGAIPELYDAPEQALEAALDYFQVPLPQDRLRDTECINGSPCPGCGWCNIDIRTKCRNCGCELKERENEKPSPEWTPKFKVGDRVMEIEDRACHVWTVEKIQCPGYFLHKPEIHGGYSSCWRSDEQLRAAPWTLSRHIPGFRPLEEGEQWHKACDFVESDLFEGFRPILVGEAHEPGDEVWRSGHGPWEVMTSGANTAPAMVKMRTRRPLPDTEREAFEKWARDYYTMTPISWESDIKQYEPTHVHGAWVAWQAARKAQ